MFGTLETVYHGVPIITLPVFGDQDSNAAKVVEAGYGLRIELKTVTEKELITSITRVVVEPRFRAAVKWVNRGGWGACLNWSHFQSVSQAGPTSSATSTSLTLGHGRVLDGVRHSAQGRRVLAESSAGFELDSVLWFRRGSVLWGVNCDYSEVGAVVPEILH